MVELDYHYFKDQYKIIATDLSKQWALDPSPEAIQKSNFTRKLNANLTIILFLKK